MAATTLTTWDEFLRLPDPPDGGHLERHDGEVVTVPPPRRAHNYLQLLLCALLQPLAGDSGVIDKESPYRPQANRQYWVADLAYIPREEMDRRKGDTGPWPVYTPPLIVEILSPSNSLATVHRQRRVALSSGAREFWIVDPEQQTVNVTTLGGERLHRRGEEIPVLVLGGVIAVD